MITTLSQRSLNLCHRINPVGEIILRKKHLSGIRYASLTSNIARAARKSAAIDASREKYRGLSRDRDDRRSGSPYFREARDDRRSAPSSFREKQTTSDRHRRPDRDGGFRDYTRRNDGAVKYDESHRWEGRGQNSKFNDLSSKKTGKGANNVKRRRGKQQHRHPSSYTAYPRWTQSCDARAASYTCYTYTKRLGKNSVPKRLLCVNWRSPAEYRSKWLLLDGTRFWIK